VAAIGWRALLAAWREYGFLHQGFRHPEIARHCLHEWGIRRNAADTCLTDSDGWFTCGALIPHGDRYAVVGWDGQPITHVDSVHAGLDAVRRFYATIAIGSAEPATSFHY